MSGTWARRLGLSLPLRGALALACVLASPPPSTGEVLRLEPTATKVRFTLGATLHEVEGFFDLTRGEIHFDPGTGEASGRVVVAAASGDTANAKRDKKLHDKVLESERFPEIVFVPRRLEGEFLPEGDSEVRIHGTIELHGDRHEIVIPASVHVEGSRLTGTARFTIPYVAWGMKDPSVFVLRVEKEVRITLDLDGTVLSEPRVVKSGPGPMH
ncbi:MAG: YceI family protein [Acidobacteriota bacterium]